MGDILPEAKSTNSWNVHLSVGVLWEHQMGGDLSYCLCYPRQTEKESGTRKKKEKKKGLTQVSFVYHMVLLSKSHRYTES